MDRAARIAVFLGTRPEGIKMAPVVHALQATTNLDALVINTGQHREMLEQVLSLFRVSVDRDLAVMVPNQTLAGLTSRLLDGVDSVLAEERPEMALVQGDTTTVLAASLACFYRGIPLGHVEAGLRSGDLTAPFPEEANRVVCSRLATLHFAPTEVARRNLLAEGVAPESIEVTGNTVIDALQLEVARQKTPSVRQEVLGSLEAALGTGWSDGRFVLVTGHRRENFGQGFEEICAALGELAKRFPDVGFVYPVHLNPNVRGPVHQRLGETRNIHLVPPVPYSQFVALLQRCHLVLTDSGGVQEEAPGLGKPVLVMRETTERPEGVDAGTVRLVGASRERIMDGVSRLLLDDDEYERMSRASNPYGDGRAAGRIVRRLSAHLATHADARGAEC